MMMLDAGLVMATLNDQRSKGSFCDALLKCGPQTTYIHSCVLSSVSGVFAKVLSEVRTSIGSSIMTLEVEELFAGLEENFLDIIDLFYSGSSLRINPDLLPVIFTKFDVKCLKHSNPVLPSQQIQLQQPALKQQLKVPQGPTEEDTKANKMNKVEEIKMDMSFCIKCDLLFISQEEYLSHKMLNCTRKYTCKTCGSMFNRVFALLDHLVEVRHGETVCSVCSLVCQSSNDMEQHVGLHLLDRKKPYFCLQCDSRFSSRYALSHHIPKHSVETPYVCQVCTKGFKWKHALTSHMITHSTDKKFLCQECGFATAYSSVFKSHQRIHSGLTLKCNLPGCTFQTIRKSNLIQHQITHSKEKSHQCEVCGKSFSLVKNMKRHMKQHDFTTEKHECQVPKCTFNTLRSDKFMEHMKKVHADLKEDIDSDKKQEGKSPFDSINPPNKTVDDVSTAIFHLKPKEEILYNDIHFQSNLVDQTNFVD